MAPGHQPQHDRAARQRLRDRGPRFQGPFLVRSNIGAHTARTRVGDFGPGLAPGSSPSVAASFVFLHLAYSPHPASSSSPVTTPLMCPTSVYRVNRRRKLRPDHIITIGLTMTHGTSPSLA